MIRILFLIRSLEAGGAERQLCDLVKGLDKRKFDIYVVTFYDGGKLRQELDTTKEIHYISLGKRKRWDLVQLFWRFFVLVKKIQPQILHGYLDMSNLLCLLVGKLLKMKVIWGVRSSYIDLTKYYWTDRLLSKILVWCSKIPDLIITNSYAGRKYFIKSGFSTENMVVINNGIDTRNFYPNRKVGERLRIQWGIKNEQKIIGLVGRLDPIKDHSTFIKASAIVAKQNPLARFVCIGSGSKTYKEELSKQIKDCGLSKKFIWAGYIEKMTAAYNSLDVLCLSSYGEGFPNAIGEAMACSIPVVTTNVGDAAEIIGDIGKVVAVGDYQHMAKELLHFMGMPKADLRNLGIRSRERIIQKYSLEFMVSNTEKTLSSLIKNEKAH
jgi:glycosyltransferase involved in cell wall biosynthesis